MKNRVFLNKIGVVLFCILSSFLYLLFFSQTLSPLYSIEACDSSVFKLMGQAVLHGKVPYADLFDHKGPMLYAIQALGQWLISGRIGLFLLAVIGLSISIFCWYKSARFFTTPLKGIIAILLSLLTYYFYAEYGNLSEDWNIPFISMSYYLLLFEIFQNKPDKLFVRSCIVGLCLACSFYIRPNDAVAFIGAPILGVFMLMLREKDTRTILKFLGGIGTGFFSITIIFIAWFAIHHALFDLWYGLIGFNAAYSTGIKGLVIGCFKVGKLCYLPLLIAIIVLGGQSSNKQILYILIPTSVAAYILLGNNLYNHYWIVWIPILFFTFWLLALSNSNKSFLVLAICVFLSLPIFDNCNWLKLPLRMYKEIRRNINYTDPLPSNTYKLFQEIDINEKDSVWSYNLTWDNQMQYFNTLIYNSIIPCNKVPLIFMAAYDPHLLQFMDITKYKPKYILFSKQDVLPLSYSVSDSLYIEKEYHIVNICEQPQLTLYKRNL